MTEPNDYVDLQTKKYMSHEADVPLWADGQRRFINEFLLPSMLAAGITDKFIDFFDAGCGDGTGLAYMKSLGYQNLDGCDLSPDKVARASAAIGDGGMVSVQDLHRLHSIKNGSFDVVYSSHTLEHCHDPAKAISELMRIAKPNALFVIVLPYPDTGPTDAHCGSDSLGTRPPDDKAERLVKWMTAQGLQVQSIRFDSYREPEVWLTAVRAGQSGTRWVAA